MKVSRFFCFIFVTFVIYDVGVDISDGGKVVVIDLGHFPVEHDKGVVSVLDEAWRLV